MHPFNSSQFNMTWAACHPPLSSSHITSLNFSAHMFKDGWVILTSQMGVALFLNLSKPPNPNDTLRTIVQKTKKLAFYIIWGGFFYKASLGKRVGQSDDQFNNNYEVNSEISGKMLHWLLYQEAGRRLWSSVHPKWNWLIWQGKPPAVPTQAACENL